MGFDDLFHQRKAKALPSPSSEVQERLEQERYVMDSALQRVQIQASRVRKMHGGDAFFKHFESKSQNHIATDDQGSA